MDEHRVGIIEHSQKKHPHSEAVVRISAHTTQCHTPIDVTRIFIWKMKHDIYLACHLAILFVKYNQEIRKLV